MHKHIKFGNKVRVKSENDKLAYRENPPRDNSLRHWRNKEEDRGYASQRASSSWSLNIIEMLRGQVRVSRRVSSVLRVSNIL